MQEKSLDTILKLLLEYGRGNFQAKAEIGDEDNTMNAVLAGLNLLGQELEHYRRDADEKDLLLKELLYNIDEVFYTLQIDGEFNDIEVLFISDQYKYLLGMTDTMPNDFSSWINAIHPEDRLSYKECLQKAANGEDITYDYRILQKSSQSYLWVSDRIWLQKSEGKANRISGAAREITQRKLQEEATNRALSEISTIELINQEALRGTGFKNILSLLIKKLHSVAGIKASRLYLYDAEEQKLTLEMQDLKSSYASKIKKLTGSFRIKSIVPPVDPGSFYYGILQRKEFIITEDPREIETLMMEHTKNSFLRKAVIHARKLLNVKSFAILPVVNEHEIVGMITFVADTPLNEDEKRAVIRLVKQTAFAFGRIKAEENVLAQKRFFESILDTLPIDIAVFDKNQKYIYVNPHAVQNEEMRSWLIGKNEYDYSHRKGLDLKFADKRAGLFQKAVQSGEEQEWLDEHQGKNGTVKHILRKYYPNYQNNDLKFVVGCGMDITGLKESEIQREKLVKDLAERINELTQFTSVVSHNLRSPVATILGLSELLEMDISMEEQQEVLNGIKTTSETMDQVLKDLNLVLATKSTSKQKAERILFAEVITEVKSILYTEVKDTSAEIKLKIDDDAAEIRSVKGYLHSIFYNLVSNAIKYRRENTPPVIEISAVRNKDRVEVRIEDNGLGIDLNKYGNQLFGLYKRFHNINNIRGQGLGLYLTKTHVEMIGGTLSVESIPNKGSTFILDLPVQYSFG